KMMDRIGCEWPRRAMGATRPYGGWLAKKTSIWPYTKSAPNLPSTRSRNDLCELSQLWVCDAPLSHFDFNSAYWSGERIVFAFFMNAPRLCFVQPPFMHSACQLSSFAF